MCHTPASRRRDSRQNNGELAVAEHVGVEASTGQAGVALAYCDTTRRVAESRGRHRVEARGGERSVDIGVNIATCFTPQPLSELITSCALSVTEEEEEEEV
ncbi:hypothetical protein EYF80_007753 [Liparis tanakae]|uniref:Uncharacterized protein n=1 Tax=Liparis tanakae TaxID=230148 RepID=A0A4Z2IWG9_9TELE|nr:hypothetical protein EYF80_007753 [Liparis tanakae]